MFGLRLLTAVPKQAWAAIGIALVAAALVLGAYGYGYGSGKANATAEAADAMDEYKEGVRDREREQERLLAKANEANSELERTYEQRISDLRASLARENAEAAARDASTIADLLTGVKRLRLATANCSSAGAGDPDASPAGANGAGSAELAPETSAALWGIAGDGDRAIRKLTALQDWARSAVALCGAPAGGDTP